MSLEPIGIFTLALGVLCLLLGSSSTVIVFVTLTVFGAAAAILAGSASIQPAHLFLGFLAFSTLSFQRDFAVALAEFKFPKPAFWLTCLLFYGAAAGFFAPRLFAGATNIIPLGTSDYPSTGGAVPLGPVSSNFTQAVYLAADLLTFVLMACIGSTERGFRAIAIGVAGFSVANAAFAILDLATYGTSMQSLFGYIRNAQYVFHDEDVVAGVKRVVGSWPEASAFAGMSLASIGFTGTMWLCGRNSRLNGSLFLISVFLVVRSTSSTGLFALPLCCVLLFLTAAGRGIGSTASTWRSTTTVVFVPPLLVTVALVLALDNDLYRKIYDYVDLLLLSKSTSSSAMVRGSWNLYAYQNFIDSFGLGVGLGTSRTSSFIFALLSNVGVPGTIFFFLFVLSVLLRQRSLPRSGTSDIQLSARNGCICIMIGALVAGPTVDLGLLFFILAGLAWARPATARVTVPQQQLFLRQIS
ncbi:hypothetical protein PMI07_005829 [Rhizobium sp. CF080]|uniref:hypothetical protein n=1 Tax=Rhizobium sp. (strain CF080) TaxID=1144310 RepID=UPI0002715640|nr:hypothetical protein [Rhizobium sp. CF080]EUB99548.1 hypothetical protein PMI07_005829 [Rhizobium sp. CF080]